MTAGTVTFDAIATLDAIIEATPAQKRMLVTIDDAARADEDGWSWIDQDTATRGESVTLRALARRGMATETSRGFALTELGRTILAAVRDEANDLANDRAADRLERRR